MKTFSSGKTACRSYYLLLPQKVWTCIEGRMERQHASKNNISLSHETRVFVCSIESSAAAAAAAAAAASWQHSC
jgi:hypothetical protein